MSDLITFTVLGKPRPLSRTGHGQFGGKYLAAPSSQQIGLIVDGWQREGSPTLPDDEPISMEVEFVFERPASHFGTGRNEGVLKHRFLDAMPTGRPDLDNLVKLVCEALQGNAFRDDSRIVTIRARKVYGRPARTLIHLWPEGHVVDMLRLRAVA